MRAALILVAVLASAAERAPLWRAIEHANLAEVRAHAAREAINVPDGSGTTPLMHAAVYGDARMMKLLLDAGADAAAVNTHGQTALHRAAHDEAKVRLLLDHRAPPHAVTRSGQSALLIAAARGGAYAIARALLEKSVPDAAMLTRAVTLAAQSGELDILQLLIAKGAKPAAAALRGAAGSGCRACVDLLREAGAPVDVELHGSTQRGQLVTVRQLLDAGASAGKPDGKGRTPLMFAVRSDYATPELASLLMERGAKADARDHAGESAADWARLQGNPGMLRVLHLDVPSTATVSARDTAREPRAAIAASLKLLQSSAPAVFRQRACVSCHSNMLPAIVAQEARRNGFLVDESIQFREIKAMLAVGAGHRDRSFEGLSIPGTNDTVSYLLTTLAHLQVPRNDIIDALAHFLTTRQAADGQWRMGGHRPPQEYSTFTTTALGARSLDAYRIPGRSAEFDDRIARARHWLTANRAEHVEEQAFKLLGLVWTHASRETIAQARQELLQARNKDRTWSQLPYLPPDSYATGLALYALQTAGMASQSAELHPGLRFLAESQHADGSWHVRSRAVAFQPYFESGYPHGHDQWISAAGGSWATLALLAALP